METLTLLKPCECCFACAASTRGGSEGYMHSAPKVLIGREHHVSSRLRRRAGTGHTGRPGDLTWPWWRRGPFRHRKCGAGGALGSAGEAPRHVSALDV
jgi:hypothetical protein